METKQACEHVVFVSCLGFFMGTECARKKIKERRINLNVIYELMGGAVAEKNFDLFKKSVSAAKKICERHAVLPQTKEAVLALAEKPEEAYDFLLEYFKEVR